MRGHLPHQNAAHLRHRLDNQHPRHNRIPRKMSREMRLVYCYVLDSNNRILTYLDDLIHHQHGVPMRQYLRDFFVVQQCHGESVLYQPMPSFLRQATEKQEETIRLIQALVECESPSHDPSATNRLNELLIESTRGLATPRLIKNKRFGHHLRLEFATGAKRASPQVLALGHSDTVWEHGTLNTHALPSRPPASMGSRHARYESWHCILPHRHANFAGLQCPARFTASSC